MGRSDSPNRHLLYSARILEFAIRLKHKRFQHISRCAPQFFTTCQQLYIKEAGLRVLLTTLQADKALNVHYSAAGSKNLVKIMLF